MKKFLRISLFSSLFMFLVFGSTSAFANEEVYEKLSEEELSSVSYVFGKQKMIEMAAKNVTTCQP